MHIGVDIRHLGRVKPSGVGQYTLEILRQFSDLSGPHTFELLSSGRRRYAVDPSILKNPQVSHTHRSIPNRLLNAQLRLGVTALSSFFERTPDILFLPNLNFVGKETVPYVVTVHDLSFELLPSTFPKKMQLWHKAISPKKLLHGASGLVVPSQSTATDLQIIYGIPPESIRTIPHGVHLGETTSTREAERVRDTYQLPPHFLLFLGTLEPRKNIVAILKAFDRFVRLNPELDTNLVLAGSNRIHVSALVHEYASSVSERIYELGYIPDADRPYLYQLAQATLFPSLYEGFGMPIGESLTVGTPVIAGHNSAMLETGAKGTILVDPYNSHDITIAMQILSQPSSRHLFLKNVSEHLAGYSWKRATQDLLEHLSEIKDFDTKTGCK